MTAAYRYSVKWCKYTHITPTHTYRVKLVFMNTCKKRLHFLQYLWIWFHHLHNLIPYGCIQYIFTDQYILYVSSLYDVEIVIIKPVSLIHILIISLAFITRQAVCKLCASIIILNTVIICRHSVNLFIDFVNIFRRLMIILASRESDKKKRRD